MNKKPDNTMSAQEFHVKQFKDFAVRHYEQLISAAEQIEDTERLAHLTKQLEKLKGGNLSIAKHLILVTAGLKIYYDEKKKQVTATHLTYTIL